jgi:hypothetical protein
MELFNAILRKTLYPRNTTEELYKTYAPKLSSCIGVFTTTLEYNNSIVIYKNPKYKDFLFFLANVLLFYDIASYKQTTIEQTIYDIVSTKYKFLKKNIHTFMEIVNDDFMELFRDIQKHYTAFARFANIWKHKRFAVQIDHDLYMTPLIRRSRNVFSLLQQGKIYLFTSPNLVNIICTALSNAPNFFVEPLVIKNPYNNIPFTKSDLYNIYFFLKQSPIIMPVLFHNYFIVDFDLRKFRDENENIIKNIAFKSYVRNASATSLYSSAVKMLKKYQSNIVIHKDFPKEPLIQILRPYLLLYFIIEYSAEEYRIHYTEEELKYKLQRLYKHNPVFGRKTVKLTRVGSTKRMTKTIDYSTNHPYFDEPIDTQTYKKTHLEIIEVNHLHDESFNNNYEEGGEESSDEDIYDNETTRPFVIVSPHPSFAIQSTLTLLPSFQPNPTTMTEYSDSDSDSDEDEHPPYSNVDSNEDEVVIENDSDDEYSN